MEQEEYFSAQEEEAFFCEFLEILNRGDVEYHKAIEGKKTIVRYNDEKCLLKRLREFVKKSLLAHC